MSDWTLAKAGRVKISDEFTKHVEKDRASALQKYNGIHLAGTERMKEGATEAPRSRF